MSAPVRPASPAARRAQIRQKFGLQVDARCLPGQTDGSPGKGDVVSRLDAVQILEEEAAARKHGLAVILRFEQLPDRLGASFSEWPMPMDAVACPE